MELEGKTAFVTGGSSGIGFGIAAALAEQGARIAITGTRRDRLEAAADQLRAGGAQIHTLQFDITDREAFSQAADEAEAILGPVDILCNNAGRGLLLPIKEATYSDWDWLLSVNIGGVVNGVQTFLPRLRARGAGGHIMATASAGGLFGSARSGLYTTTKMAVVGMMECLRGEVAEENIGVSVFCPHLVRSRIREHAALRPGADRSAAQPLRYDPDVGMDPLEAGRRAVEGIRYNDLYILSHPEIEGIVRERFDSILAALPDEEPDPKRVAAEGPSLSYSVYTEARAPRQI
jgi:NAD(P)-dependent dehydrogenase (short-subunit alcohol dehydrogenase family)